jgi:hypothetical protein
MDIYSNIPYTYFIQWTKTGMKYYGVRYSKNCHPDDLWITYFTSSKYVKDYIIKHGDPDLVEVRKTFCGDGRVQSARIWEYKVLKRINAVKRIDFLNKTDNKSIGLHDPAVKERQRLAIIAAISTPEFKKKHSAATKAAMSRPDVKEKHREAVTAAQRRPEERAKRSGANSPRFDHTIYEFRHTDGTIEKALRSELATKYNLGSGPLSLIISGNRKTYKGWSVNQNFSKLKASKTPRASSSTG